MRICAVCKKGIRDGDNPQPVRIDPADITPELAAKLRVTVAILPGLQSACGECQDVLRPVIAARLGLDVAGMTDQHMA